MENEIMLNEKNMIEIELLNCFNYFKVLHELERCSDNYEKLLQETKTKLEELDDAAYTRALECNKLKEEFLATVPQKILKDLNTSISNQKSKYYSDKGDLSLIFGVIFSIGVTIGSFALAKSGVFFSVLGVIASLFTMLLVYGIILQVTTIINTKQNIKDLEEHKKSLLEKYNLDPYSIIPSDYEVDEKEFYKWLTQRENFYESIYSELPELKETREELLNKIEELESKIASSDERIKEFTDNEKPNLSNMLQVIPVYYFEEDAVRRMLFLMVNKRADNIKELVNLYEDLVWKDQLLQGVNRLDQSLNNMVNEINKNFQLLAQHINQVGVALISSIGMSTIRICESIEGVNQGIKENTNILIENQEQLKKIEDSDTRHYLEMSYNMNKINSYLD